jgi:hypothetical protein
MITSEQILFKSKEFLMTNSLKCGGVPSMPIRLFSTPSIEVRMPKSEHNVVSSVSFQ